MGRSFLRAFSSITLIILLPLTRQDTRYEGPDEELYKIATCAGSVCNDEVDVYKILEFPCRPNSSIRRFF